MDKDGGSAEELGNDGQRCAASDDASTTEDLGQVIEAKRCADVQYCSHRQV